MPLAARTYRLQSRATGVERTRERVLGVAQERFFTLPYDEVRLGEVAAAAGVSEQTLLNHFSSKEGLLLAVAEFVGPEVEGLRGPVVPGDVDAAVRGLLRQYEAFGDGNVRLVAVAERIPALDRAVEVGRRGHTAWLEATFADFLPTDPAARRRALAALYAVTDVGTWKLLRRDLGRSRRDTAAVLRTLLRAALESVRHL
jgi:AcrR family transcriptional regulator